MTMLSLMGFSQAGTVTKDTTKVVISSEVARQIAKDLVRLDGCIQENTELYTKISKIEDREKQKDQKIEILQEKDNKTSFFQLISLIMGVLFIYILTQIETYLPTYFIN